MKILVNDEEIDVVDDVTVAGAVDQSLGLLDFIQETVLQQDPQDLSCFQGCGLPFQDLGLVGLPDVSSFGFLCRIQSVQEDFPDEVFDALAFEALWDALSGS